MTEKFKLYIVVSDKSDLGDFTNYELFKDYFEVIFVFKIPSFKEIVFSKQSFFLLSKRMRQSFKLHYKIIRLLKKNFNEFIFARAFNIINPDKKAIIIAPEINLADWIYHQLPQEYKTLIVSTVFRYPLPSNKQHRINRFMQKLQNYNVNYDFKGLVLVFNVLVPETFDFIKAKYPNAQIVFKLVDPTIKIFNAGLELKEILKDKQTSNSEILDKIKALGVTVCSYSKVEASFYSLNYEPNWVDFSYLKQLVLKNAQNSGWFFAGACQGECYQTVLNLAQSLEKAKIKAKFIVADLKGSAKDKFIEFSKVSKFIEISFDLISYDEYLKYQASSPVVIDLFRLYPDEGFSYRISEALAMNKAILTNRTSIMNESFYNEDFILYSKDLIISPDRLVKLSQAKVEYTYSAIAKYDVQNSLLAQSLK